MGLAGPTLRLPMTPLSPEFHATVESALQAGGLID